jgi:hypothetical protein
MKIRSVCVSICLMGPAARAPHATGPDRLLHRFRRLAPAPTLHPTARRVTRQDAAVEPIRSE